MNDTTSSGRPTRKRKPPPSPTVTPPPKKRGRKSKTPKDIYDFDDFDGTGDENMEREPLVLSSSKKKDTEVAPEPKLPPPPALKLNQLTTNNAVASSYVIADDNMTTSDETSSTASEAEVPSTSKPKAPTIQACYKCYDACEEPADTVQCDGVCYRTYHKQCIGKKSDNYEVAADWKCAECTSGKHECFVCNVHTSDVVPCSEKGCGRFYHKDCLTPAYPHGKREKDGSFVCPLHFCLTCHVENSASKIHRTVKKKMVSCLKCPTAYHILDDCLAAGTVMVVQDKKVICTEHHIPAKGKGKKGQMHINVNMCLICSEGGELLCCDRCPNAFHKDCAKVSEVCRMILCEACILFLTSS